MFFLLLDIQIIHHPCQHQHQQKTVMPPINYHMLHFWSARNMSHKTALSHKFHNIRIIVEWRVSDHSSVNISQ